jgi:hypothetical protein
MNPQSSQLAKFAGLGMFFNICRGTRGYSERPWQEPRPIGAFARQLTPLNNLLTEIRKSRRSRISIFGLCKYQSQTILRQSSSAFYFAW